MTLTDVLPSRLPLTSSARLRVIADIIERKPGVFDMDSYLNASDMDEEEGLRGGVRFTAGKAKEVSCGTTACVAGWAVLLAPPSQRQDLNSDWDKAGGKLLGLSYDAACSLFYSGNRDVTPELLRELARMPEPRSMDDLDNARSAVGIKPDRDYERV